MKDQMQYIVIEGRKPQDGAKPTQALLILPKWISPTLACAGIVGRVIELTDGNVIEQGAIPMDEQGMLEALREDMHLDTESQREETNPTAIDPNAVQPVLSNEDPHIADAAYRQGMEAQRNAILGEMSRAGMPPNTRPMDWVRGLVAELAELKNPPAPVDEFHYSQQWELLNSLTEAFGCPAGSARLEWLRAELEELAQFRKDRPETLAKLQTAEDNLDAWRDAAGANSRIRQYTDEKTGRITRLAITVDATESEAEEQMQRALDQRDDEIERLRTLLKGIRRMTKKATR